MAYCEEHSGELNRIKSQCFCLKLCARDMHEDLCSECSEDLLESKNRFYQVSIFMSLFCVAIFLVVIHVLLSNIPSLCGEATHDILKSESFLEPSGIQQIQATNWCVKFQKFWHDTSLYAQQPDTNSAFDFAFEAMNLSSQHD